MSVDLISVCQSSLAFWKSPEFMSAHKGWVSFYQGLHLALRRPATAVTLQSSSDLRVALWCQRRRSSMDIRVPSGKCYGWACGGLESSLILVLVLGFELGRLK